jgi:hypothetical protein
MLLTILLTIAVVTALAFIMTKAVNDRGGCPICGTPVPMWRHPKSFRQALWGGWTCEECGTEMDRRGRKLVANS